MTFKCVNNTKENPCNFSPKVSGYLTKRLDRPYVHFRGFDEISNKSFLEQKLSLCSVEKQIGLNIFIRSLIDQVKEHIKFDCPINTVRFILTFLLILNNSKGLITS